MYSSQPASKARLRSLGRACAVSAINGMAEVAALQLNLGGLEANLDYAFRQVEFFDNSNVFSLKLGF